MLPGDRMVQYHCKALWEGFPDDRSGRRDPRWAPWAVPGQWPPCGRCLAAG